MQPLWLPACRICGPSLLSSSAIDEAAMTPTRLNKPLPLSENVFCVCARVRLGSLCRLCHVRKMLCVIVIAVPASMKQAPALEDS